MKLYTGLDLENFLRNARDIGLKERFVKSNLDKYIDSGNDGKVCCLFGLRRTGKTVMMLQKMRQIGNYDTTLWITCEPQDSMGKVYRAMESYPECKYVFLDEITRTSNFVNASSTLADCFAMSGRKIVMAGTDSLSFVLAKNDLLYDRMYMIHTTFISYAEYNYLFGKDIMHYIEYGGTLSPENTFYNNDSLDEYSNSAIVKNIINSLKRWNDGVNFGTDILGELLESNELPSAINKVIELDNRSFLARTINRKFKSHDLGDAKDLMERHQIADTAPLDDPKVTDMIRDNLGILVQHSTFSDEIVGAIIRYLKSIDVLYEIPDTQMGKGKEYIFTQIGMRYCQCTALAETLMNLPVFKSSYSENQRTKILEKIQSGICGDLLENIVFYQLSRVIQDSADLDGKAISVSKFRTETNQEIDILIKNFAEETLVAIEVKLSTERHPNQTIHLLNKELNEEIQKKTGLSIQNKLVLYRGKNFYDDSGILYVNVEDFLKNTEKMVKLLSTEKICSIKKLFSSKSKAKFDYADNDE